MLQQVEIVGHASRDRFAAFFGIIEPTDPVMISQLGHLDIGNRNNKNLQIGALSMIVLFTQDWSFFGHWCEK